MKAVLSAAAISLLACNAAAAQTNPLLGRWRIEAAAVGPWVAPDKIHTTIKEDDVRRFVKQRVTFEAATVKSRDPLLACKDARYEPTRIPPAGLFQGSLPEPKGESPARSVCSTASRRVSMSPVRTGASRIISATRTRPCSRSTT